MEYQQLIQYIENTISQTGKMPEKLRYSSKYADEIKNNYISRFFSRAEVDGDSVWVGNNPFYKESVQSEPDFEIEQSFISSVFPNPNHTGIILLNVYADTRRKILIKLMTVEGKDLGIFWMGKLYKGMNEIYLDLSALPSGKYNISILYEGKILDSTKFLLVK